MLSPMSREEYSKLASKVSKEITNRNDCSGIDENSGNFESLFGGIGRERFLDEHLQTREH